MKESDDHTSSNSRGISHTNFEGKASTMTREELKDQITEIIYGADWKDQDVADAFKPDVEAAMKVIDDYTRGYADMVIGDTKDPYDDLKRRSELRAEQRERNK